MDDLDIYGDLDVDEIYVEKNKERENARINELESEVRKHRDDIEKLKKDNERLNKKVKIMETNFNNLFDVVKSEISRKDAQIHALRKEKDNLIFRRNVSKENSIVNENINEKALSKSDRTGKRDERDHRKRDEKDDQGSKDNKEFKDYRRDRKRSRSRDRKRRRSKSPKTNSPERKSRSINSHDFDAQRQAILCQLKEEDESLQEPPSKNGYIFNEHFTQMDNRVFTSVPIENVPLNAKIEVEDRVEYNNNINIVKSKYNELNNEKPSDPKQNPFQNKAMRKEYTTVLTANETLQLCGFGVAQNEPTTLKITGYQRIQKEYVNKSSESRIEKPTRSRKMSEQEINSSKDKENSKDSNTSRSRRKSFYERRSCSTKEVGDDKSKSSKGNAQKHEEKSRKAIPTIKESKPKIKELNKKDSNSSKSKSTKNHDEKLPTKDKKSSENSSHSTKLEDKASDKTKESKKEATSIKVEKRTSVKESSEFPNTKLTKKDSETDSNGCSQKCIPSEKKLEKSSLADGCSKETLENKFPSPLENKNNLKDPIFEAHSKNLECNNSQSKAENVDKEEIKSSSSSENQNNSVDPISENLKCKNSQIQSENVDTKDKPIEKKEDLNENKFLVQRKECKETNHKAETKVDESSKDIENNKTNEDLTNKSKEISNKKTSPKSKKAEAAKTPSKRSKRIENKISKDLSLKVDSSTQNVSNTNSDSTKTNFSDETKEEALDDLKKKKSVSEEIPLILSCSKNSPEKILESNLDKKEALIENTQVIEIISTEIICPPLEKKRRLSSKESSEPPTKLLCTENISEVHKVPLSSNDRIENNPPTTLLCTENISEIVSVPSSSKEIQPQENKSIICNEIKVTSSSKELQPQENKPIICNENKVTSSSKELQPQENKSIICNENKVTSSPKEFQTQENSPIITTEHKVTSSPKELKIITDFGQNEKEDNFEKLNENMRNLFQSPQESSAANISQMSSNYISETLLKDLELSNITTDNSSFMDTSVSFANASDSLSKKNISTSSKDYIIETVDEYVTNVTIKRKKRKGKSKSISGTL